jgi:hypothetical protein
VTDNSRDHPPFGLAAADAPLGRALRHDVQNGANPRRLIRGRARGGTPRRSYACPRVGLGFCLDYQVIWVRRQCWKICTYQ